MRWFFAALLSALSPTALAAEPVNIVNIAAVSEAVRLIEERFPEDIHSPDLYRAALQGIVADLNRRVGVPANAILTAEEHDAFEQWMRGARNGIGARYENIAKQGLLIEQIFPGGTAEAAGLLPNDLVVGINGSPFTGMDDGQIYALTFTEIQRPTITLNLKRDQQLRTFTLTRGPYQYPSVQVCAEDPQCIQIMFFGEDAAADLRVLLNEMGPVPGLILDLRYNEGGLLDESLAAASLFLESGAVIAIRRKSDGTEEPLVASGERAWEDGQILILINQDTSGAAEVFAAALRDHGVGTLWGTPTRGMALEPGFYPLDNGLVLQLADAELLRPNRESWLGRGVIPDQPINPLTNSPGGRLPDIQLDTLRRVLHRP
ncbi:MAG: S41 family peptidase [Myxococcota bacterium]